MSSSAGPSKTPPAAKLPPPGSLPFGTSPSPWPSPPSSFPPYMPGDGAHPAPITNPRAPVGVTQSLSLLQDALGNHLPRRLAQAQASSRRIRAAVGKGR